MFKFILSSILVFSLMLSGCAYNQPSEPTGKNSTTIEDSDLIQSSEKAVSDLVNNCNIVIDKTKPIIVTSLVDVTDLEKSSSMGLMTSEIIANKLSQQGYTVKELKMGQNKVFVKEGKGEFILSRNIKEIARNHDVQAVVVGTYAIGEEMEAKKYGEATFNRPISKLYISLRIIETETNNIGCSVGYSMTIGNANIWK